MTEARDSFLERVFGGALRPVLAHFVARENLTPAVLADLRRMLADERREKTNRQAKPK